ncbi:MAG: tyrosine-type recombinase/integrase [Polyangiaceae bacterium]
MPRAATGELRRLATGFAARITLRGRARKDYVLTTCATEREASERCAALASLAARLRRCGHLDELEAMMAIGARARAGRSWVVVVGAVDALCAGRTREAGGDVPTFAEFGQEWTGGELARRWPDHVPTKASAKDDARLLKLYIEPIVGDVRLDKLTLADADDVMASLPERLSPSSRRHVAQVVRRLLTLAVYPARHIPESPIPRGWLPRGKSTKAFTCLWPAEDADLLACQALPLVRRLFFGVIAREGMRREEAARLHWRDVDPGRGLVRLDENKTDDPRAWALDAGVAAALRLWRSHFRADAVDHEYVFQEAGRKLYVDQMANHLREDLKTAGVTRAELFERTAVRRPIRLHDLRATFVTVSLANGKSETWVADRTGHRSSAMINRYRRQARTWAELGLGELAPLDRAVPELAAVAKVERPVFKAPGIQSELPAGVRAHQAPGATRAGSPDDWQGRRTAQR